ncbi:18059_t:CDS:2 [Acaulospora morrowiae]|uniref:18059_t:CDS:1 n=1 Tax=Acaulospora morrowiae TaxID=94023 RepID=A0A9N8VGG9_9GLOM|nr:18059_t:CDS:2 [Acaulospora morrowiae]
MAFRSFFLIHGNLLVITGARHSIVFYIYNTVIKQKLMFGSIFIEHDLEGGDNGHKSPKEANSDEVTDFWKGIESDRNVKEYGTALENLDMLFTVERTLEHNDYINEVGQRRRQVMKRTSENYQEEKFIDSNQSNKNNYSLRKKPRVNYNEEETSPSPRQPADNLPFDNIHESDDSDTGIESNCPAIINDVMELQLGPLPRKESRWLVNDMDVSEKWHLFKEESLKLAKREGLFVESHTQQILSLSHILLLKSKQHCPSIVERLQRKEITRDDAVSELQVLAFGRSYGERAILKAIRNIIESVPRVTLKSPVGEVELCTSYIDTILCPIFSDPDSGDEESKARKYKGRAKQPDVIINEINQLSWGLSKGHDAIDFYNMNCMLGFQVVGQHITFYLTTLLCDALYVMVEVGHIDVTMSLEQVPAFLTSLDTLLIISDAFWANCIVSTEKKEPSRRSTLATPSFREMVSKSRDRHRPCQLRF